MYERLKPSSATGASASVMKGGRRVPALGRPVKSAGVRSWPGFALYGRPERIASSLSTNAPSGLAGLRVCMLGQHEPGYPRNVLTRRLLHNLGCSVTEATSLAPGVLREAVLAARFARQLGATDVLFVTEGGHRFVPVLAPLARAAGIPIVFDAFTSRYNTYVEDRQTVAAGTL